MIYTALTEGFFTQVKVAAFGALFLSFPVVASQLWLFIAPGLYKHERNAFLPFLVASPILFALGAALVYFLVIPLAWAFRAGSAGGGIPLPDHDPDLRLRHLFPAAGAADSARSRRPGQ
jgi:sec-independent protein translocase protein TatC